VGKFPPKFFRKIAINFWKILLEYISWRREFIVASIAECHLDYMANVTHGSPHETYMGIS